MVNGSGSSRGTTCPMPTTYEDGAKIKHGACKTEEEGYARNANYAPTEIVKVFGDSPLPVS